MRNFLGDLPQAKETSSKMKSAAFQRLLEHDWHREWTLWFEVPQRSERGSIIHKVTGRQNKARDR